MDGPHVNWKFHKIFSRNLERECSTKLIDIGSCGLHIIHNAFKCEAKVFEIENVLNSLHWLFKDSPARSEDFMKVTHTTEFPLKFCSHRWVENLPIVTRAMKIWPAMKVYVAQVENKEISKPTNNSYTTIKMS